RFESTGSLAAARHGPGSSPPMASRLAVALFTLLTVRPSQIARAGCDPQFFCETLYPAGTSPHGLVVGDFNADGIADIAVANAGGSITVHFGHGHAGVGDGTFGADCDSLLMDWP